MTGRGIAEQVLAAHRVAGDADELVVTVDQVLLQDTTGSTVMLALEALALDRVSVPVAVQYVDHQIERGEEPEYADLVDQAHRWLSSACRRFGLWYSPPGHGISHLVHLEAFTQPGEVIIGSDSHTCMAGALGALGFGAGGMDVALTLAGEPARLPVPVVRGIELVGTLPDGVGPKDVGLELLRRYGVDGGKGRILEFHGPGVAALDIQDRVTIAGHAAEAGAISSIFPADEVTEATLRHWGRPDAFRPLVPEPGTTYDEVDRIDLNSLEPLVAMPSRPDNVVPLREVAGTPIVQGYLGSSGNPSLREHAQAIAAIAGRSLADGVRLDVNLPTRRMADVLAAAGLLDALQATGATLHAVGCDEFNRADQAPPADEMGLRAINRNHPGRSGTPGDRVALASPLTVMLSAVHGRITDPRTAIPLGDPPSVPPVDDPRAGLVPPLPPEQAAAVTLDRGDNIVALPVGEPLPEELTVTVAATLGDDVTTEQVLPAGPDVQRYRTNLPKLAPALLRDLDPGYQERVAGGADHAIVAGRNYGQGSSREHAALGPRVLGLQVVLARSFARIHRRNLVNAGILPLLLTGDEDPALGERLQVRGLRGLVEEGREVEVQRLDRGTMLGVAHDLTAYEREVLGAGGLLAARRVG